MIQNARIKHMKYIRMYVIDESSLTEPRTQKQSVSSNCPLKYHVEFLIYVIFIIPFKSTGVTIILSSVHTCLQNKPNFFRVFQASGGKREVGMEGARRSWFGKTRFFPARLVPHVPCALAHLNAQNKRPFWGLSIFSKKKKTYSVAVVSCIFAWKKKRNKILRDNLKKLINSLEYSY